MDESQFFKDPPRLILDLMKRTFGEYFVTYFLESPTNLIAEAQYPCLIVESGASNNTVTGAPTGTDVVSEQINIYVIESSKDNMNASDDVDVTKRKLYQLIQGRDSTTGFYLPDTLLYALRTNITLTNGNTATIIDSDINTNYLVIERPDQPMLVSAKVSIVTKERVIIQSRS